MARGGLFDSILSADLLETLLPDFLLAFTFFTALAYAVLFRHFGQKRPAAAMSVALGLALAVGLVWWERSWGWSMRDLGPVALVLVLLVLGIVVYRAVKPDGGKLSGLAIAVGVALLLALVLDVEMIEQSEIAEAIVGVAIIGGTFALLLHHKPPLREPHEPQRRASVQIDKKNARSQRRAVKKDRHIGKWIRQRLKRARDTTATLVERPEERADVLLQIRRILPAEGWLTERLARLRETAQNIRSGHLARLEETKTLYAGLPTPDRKRLAAELAARYSAMVGIDTRIERLDRAAAEAEQRIRNLTNRASTAVARYDHVGAVDLLKEAERLQKHNVKLFTVIERTEQKLTRIIREVASSPVE